MKKIFLALLILIVPVCLFSKEYKVSQSYNLSSGIVNEYHLKNGIPVYINDKVPNQVNAIYIIVEGGTSKQAVAFSGLESALFEMMTMGSKKYSYDQIKMLEYENQSSISHYTIYSGSVLTLNCINYYLDQMLPVMLDGFINPSFNQKEYDFMMNQIIQQVHASENDPESILFNRIHKTVYKNHPLLTTSRANSDSVKNITINNLKKHHEELMDPLKIKVVAVGKIDINTFLNQLDLVLGEIPPKESYKGKLVYDQRYNNPKVKMPAVKIKGKKVVLKNKDATGSEMIVRVFSSPAVDSEDYVVACITSEIFSTLMFNIVREKYGACYSPGSQIDSSPVPIGIDYGLRVSDMENFPKYLKEAEELMKEGKVISSVDKNGATYDTLENTLPGVINSYLVRKYSSQSTSSGIASRITSSILQFGDLTSADKIPNQAKAITKDDVLRVFNKYWLSSDYRWFEMRGE